MSTLTGQLSSLGDFVPRCAPRPSLDDGLVELAFSTSESEHPVRNTRERDCDTGSVFVDGHGINRT
jgi:hypothetical protein